MTDIVELHARAVEAFGARVRSIVDGQWHEPTPCSDWDVRALVNHLVGESLWTAPLFEGKTIAEVGDRFDGDVLGSDPAAAWDASEGPALAALRGEGAMDRIVHLSFGDVPGSVYAWQLFFDYLIHGWDLARAIGAVERLDPELVQAAAEWFATQEEQYRQGGVIAERPDVPDGVDAQTRLLAMAGRTA